MILSYLCSKRGMSYWLDLFESKVPHAKFHETLKAGWGISKTKRHSVAFMEAQWSDCKCGLKVTHLSMFRAEIIQNNVYMYPC